MLALTRHPPKMSHEIKQLEKYLESRGPKFVEGEEQVIIEVTARGSTCTLKDTN